MEPGSLGSKFEDRVNPLERTLQLISDTVGIGPGPFAAQIFGAGAQEYTEKYEATWEHVAAIGASLLLIQVLRCISDSHSRKEPSAQRQQPVLAVRTVLFLPRVLTECMQVPQLDDDRASPQRQEGHRRSA